MIKQDMSLKKGIRLIQLNHFAWVSLFAFGLAIRLKVALGRADMFWPDEQFQTLEPAAKVVYGYGYMAWEWLEGYRSWFVPVLYMPVLKLGTWFGIQGGLSSIHLARSVTAFFDIAMWIAIARTLVSLRIPGWAIWLAVATQMLSPTAAIWGSSTLQDHVLMIIFGLGFPWILQPGKSASKGFWIGLPFLAKVQAGTWIAGLLGFEFFSKPNDRWNKKSAAFYSAAFVIFLAYGLIDWVSWGVPFQTLFKQIKDGNQISIFYGTEPFSFYFKNFTDIVGLPAFLLMLVCLTRMFFFPKPETLHFSKPLWALILSATLFFSVMTGLPHKEIRFLLPLVPVWTVILAELLPKAFNPNPSLSRYGVAVTLGVLLGLYLPLSRHAIQRPIYLTSTDISQLENQIYLHSKVHNKNFNTSSCIVLVTHNWSWTRGNMILGKHFEYLETRDAQPALSPVFEKCRYAIIPEREKDYFKTVWKNWVPYSDQGIWTLLIQELPK